MLLLLRTILMPYLMIGRVSPDLTMSLLVFITLRYGVQAGISAGFVAGLLRDCISAAPLGFHALNFTLLCLIFGNVNRYLYAERLINFTLYVVAATAMKRLISALILALFVIPVPDSLLFSKKLLLEVGYNVLVAPVGFLLSTRFLPLLYRYKGDPR